MEGGSNGVRQVDKKPVRSRRGVSRAEDRRSLACHEAAHCVLGRLFRQTISGVVFMASTGKRYGKVDVLNPHSPIERIALDLAGMVAEERLGIIVTRPPEIAQSAVEAVVSHGIDDQHLWPVFSDDAVGAAFVALGVFETRELTLRPEAEALDRIAEGQRLAERLLDQHWGAVERLAEHFLALVEPKYFVKGEDVMQILADVVSD
jgi:hypothetical protein